MPGVTSTDNRLIDRQLAAAAAAICMLAFGVRLLLLRGLGCISADGVFYLEIADRHRQGLGAFDPIFPPLYPLLSAWMSALTPDLQTAGQLVSAAAGALGALPVVVLGRRVFGRRAAIYAGALYALHPGLAQYGADVMSEATFTALLATASLAGYYLIVESKHSAALVTGALLGLAALLRPEAAAYLPAALLAIAWKGHRQRSVRRSVLRRAALLTLAFAVITFPYARYLKQTTGHWTLSGKTRIMLAKAVAVGSEDIGIGVDQRMRDANRPGGILDDLLDHPLGLARRVGTNVHLVHKYVIPELLPPLLLIAAALGLIRLKARDRGQTFLLACAVPYVPVLAFVVDPRVFLPLVPLALIWAGAGLDGLQSSLSATTSGKRVSRAHPVLLVLLLSLLPFTMRTLYRTDENAVYKRAGLWLKENEPGDLRIAFPKPWVAYYAGGQRIGIPASSQAEVLRELRDRGATHLVVDTRIVPAVRPTLIGLLDNPCPPEGLTPLRHLTDPLGQHVFIYRIESSS